MLKNYPITYAFIDAQNLHLGVREMGWKLDWKKFRQYLWHTYHVSKAFVFLGYLPRNHRLYSGLRDDGFEIIFKTVLETEATKVKGNIDAELVLHSMIELPNYSKAVIVTSDGDFTCLVQYLYRQEKLRSVISPYKSTCSSLLQRAAVNRIAYLERLRTKLEYKKRRGTSEGRSHIR